MYVYVYFIGCTVYVYFLCSSVAPILHNQNVYLVTTSVGPSILQTESSGVLDGSASVISASWGGWARCLACKALSLLPFFCKCKIQEINHVANSPIKRVSPHL